MLCDNYCIERAVDHCILFSLTLKKRNKIGGTNSVNLIVKVVNIE